MARPTYKQLLALVETIAAMKKEGEIVDGEEFVIENDDAWDTVMRLISEARELVQQETVHTWADGFGRWHARVDFPSEGYGPAELSEHASRIRAKARRAIRREIAARQGCQNFTLRIEVKEQNLDADNVMHSITYAERVD